MNTSELEQLCARDKYIRPMFLGVFPCDRLPPPKARSCFIANTKPEGHKGEHWIAAAFDGKGHGTYFDSFGRKPDDTFKQYFGNLSYERSNRPIQDYDSLVCGDYCVCFLHFYCRGVPMHTFLKLFTSFDNDKIVSMFVRRKMN